MLKYDDTISCLDIMETTFYDSTLTICWSPFPATVASSLSLLIMASVQLLLLKPLSAAFLVIYTDLTASLRFSGILALPIVAVVVQRSPSIKMECQY